jgi:hypothetical protein
LLFGLGPAEWITILLLIASVPLTLKVMARGAAAYERKAAERAKAAETLAAGDGTEGPEQLGDERTTT